MPPVRMPICAALVCALTLSVGCQAKPGADNAAPESAPSRLTIESVETPPHEELADALITHLDNMAALGSTLSEFCPDLTGDLNAYFDLVEELYKDARPDDFDDAQRASLAASYDRVAKVAGRCLSVEAGRNLSRRLSQYVRPLTSG